MMSVARGLAGGMKKCIEIIALQLKGHSNKLIFPFLLGLQVSFAQVVEPISIKGSVTNSPMGYKPKTQVHAINPRNKELIMQTQTKQDGTFELNFFPDEKPDVDLGKLNIPMPNPFEEQTNILFQANNKGIYFVSVHNILDQIIYTGEFELRKGEIIDASFSGLGNPGTYIVNITGNELHETFKIIQSTGNDFLDVTLKSLGIYSLGEDPYKNIRLRFYSDYHGIKDTLVNFKSHDDLKITIRQKPRNLTVIIDFTLINDIMMVVVP